jgi:hypothetical protein
MSGIEHFIQISSVSKLDSHITVYQIILDKFDDLVKNLKFSFTKRLSVFKIKNGDAKIREIF